MSVAESVDTAALRTLQRVVMPVDRDLDVLKLYVDGEIVRGADADGGTGQVDRRGVVVPIGRRVSFETYFNAFPAGYWRRWTDVDEVRLSIRLSGAATVAVYKSNARGNPPRGRLIHSMDGVVDVDLTPAPFGDGGG